MRARKVLVTGASGFIGKNLQLRLAERNDLHVTLFDRNDAGHLEDIVRDVDFVFHLAGINRPLDPSEFAAGNADLTQALCGAVRTVAETTGKRVPIAFASSTQAERANPYGLSKKAAEDALLELAREHNIPVYIFRLPNVFGKWGKPNYNSAVATFCHNIARGLPIQINDANAVVTLVHVDDVIANFVQVLDATSASAVADRYSMVQPQYTATVGELAAQIQAFKDSRESLLTERVGTGLARALYSTYVSYLPAEAFTYVVPQHGDARGTFVEMLKTQDSGQFSYFTAHPGITRGGHYHHTKTEKFLVIKGRALFKFRHMQTGETHQLITSGEKSQVVETVPGWTHDITNIGLDEMVVMLWANEVFDRARPDTFACPV
ncbi:NAD-dependent epimerase/dehydratase family protein [Variovorax sp. dw_954]|uniref:UDP-2-acetamido-2,6-beta-L-arabino-hexul-4-ose reductase n=1 Tax=Variovorax sp. dw_954 TaxID=2720078 RepID=UPI001BD5E363|nr:NAD-dependent epimerase/dehydratase family protein [Variovorax sp. dw_954]